MSGWSRPASCLRLPASCLRLPASSLRLPAALFAAVERRNLTGYGKPREAIPKGSNPSPHTGAREHMSTRDGVSDQAPPSDGVGDREQQNAQGDDEELHKHEQAIFNKVGVRVRQA